MTQRQDEPGPTLDPQEGECVLCFVARAVTETGCDGTLRWSGWFVEVRVPPATSLVRRLVTTGATCDCAVTGESFTLVREQLVRDVHTDELMAPERWPTCAGVRRSSAQPCRHWERVRGGAVRAVRAVSRPPGRPGHR